MAGKRPLRWPGRSAALATGGAWSARLRSIMCAPPCTSMVRRLHCLRRQHFFVDFGTSRSRRIQIAPRAPSLPKRVPLCRLTSWTAQARVVHPGRSNRPGEAANSIAASSDGSDCRVLVSGTTSIQPAPQRTVPLAYSLDHPTCRGMGANYAWPSYPMATWFQLSRGRRRSEAVFQPDGLPRDTTFRIDSPVVEPLSTRGGNQGIVSDAAEFGRPMWSFGYSTMDFLRDQNLCDTDQVWITVAGGFESALDDIDCLTPDRFLPRILCGFRGASSTLPHGRAVDLAMSS